MEKPAQHRQLKQAGLSSRPAFLLQHFSESFRISSAWPVVHCAGAMSISHFPAPCMLLPPLTHMCVQGSPCPRCPSPRDSIWLQQAGGGTGRYMAAPELNVRSPDPARSGGRLLLSQTRQWISWWPQDQPLRHSQKIFWALFGD